MDPKPGTKTGPKTGPTGGPPPGASAGALGAGLTFAVTVALFALGGLWLDGRLGSKPWCVLAGTLLGIVGGTIHLLRVLAPETLPFGRRRPPDRT